MSASRLTGSPGCRSFRVVCSSVCGMIMQAKRSRPASFTVSEMPSTAMEPLTATSGARDSGIEISSRQLSPTGSKAAMVPTASAWPKTRWPPSSSPSRSERSRLMRVPSVQLPSVVRASVSGEAWTRKRPGSFSTTVRQTPECATEAPSAISSSGRSLATTRSRSAPSRTLSTRPIWVMIPVNKPTHSLPVQPRPAR